MRPAIKPARSCSPATSSGPGWGCSCCWHCWPLCPVGQEPPAQAPCPLPLLLLPSPLQWGLQHQQPLIPRGRFMPGPRCPPSRHVLMAAIMSAAPRRGHPAPPSSEAGSSLAHRTSTRQQGHPEAHPQPHSPLPHGTGTTRPRRPNPALCCPENSSPAPNPLPPHFSLEKEGDPPCRGAGLPLPRAAAGSGEGARPVSQRSAGAARALRLLLAQLLHVH